MTTTHTKIMSVGLTLGFLLGAPASFSGTRIGSARIVDPSLNFASQLSDKWVETGKTFGEGRIISPFANTNLWITGSNGISVRPRFLIEPSDSLYPDMKHASRAQVVARFENDPNWSARTTKTPCARAYLSSGNTDVRAVIFWGAQRGIVSIGSASPDVLAAIELFVSEFEVLSGACQWKK